MAIGVALASKEKGKSDSVEMYQLSNPVCPYQKPQKRLRLIVEAIRAHCYSLLLFEQSHINKLPAFYIFQSGQTVWIHISTY